MVYRRVGKYQRKTRRPKFNPEKPSERVDSLKSFFHHTRYCSKGTDKCKLIRFKNYIKKPYHNHKIHNIQHNKGYNKPNERKLEWDDFTLQSPMTTTRNFPPASNSINGFYLKEEKEEKEERPISEWRRQKLMDKMNEGPFSSPPTIVPKKYLPEYRKNRVFDIQGNVINEEPTKAPSRDFLLTKGTDISFETVIQTPLDGQNVSKTRTDSIILDKSVDRSSLTPCRVLQQQKKNAYSPINTIKSKVEGVLQNQPISNRTRGKGNRLEILMSQTENTMPRIGSKKRIPKESIQEPIINKGSTLGHERYLNHRNYQGKNPKVTTKGQQRSKDTNPLYKKDKYTRVRKYQRSEPDRYQHEPKKHQPFRKQIQRDFSILPHPESTIKCSKKTWDLLDEYDIHCKKRKEDNGLSF